MTLNAHPGKNMWITGKVCDGMLSKIVINMTQVIRNHMPKFQGGSLNSLGGVRGRTDTQTDTHTEGLPALII